MSKAPSPTYSKAIPPRRTGEYEQPTHEIGGDLIYPAGGAGAAKELELIGGTNIVVTDLSSSAIDRFRIDYSPNTAVDVELTLIAKELTVAKSNPILKGTVIDEVELSWTINKAVSAQTLTNGGGLIAPTLAPADRAYEYTEQEIEGNITFTLFGEDGLGSDDSDQASITFGNNFIVGHDVDLSGGATSILVTAADSMTKTVKTARTQTYYATGGVNQHHYVLYPKAWGLGTFTKGIFTGGYVRLKSVGGTLKTELSDADVEADILITNEKGYSEAYYVYMSLYDNQEDAVTPFVIS